MKPPSTRHRRNRHRGTGAGSSTRIVIAALRSLHGGPLTVAELAAGCGVHWRTSYRIVAELETAGVIVRVSPRRRANRYRLAARWIAGRA